MPQVATLALVRSSDLAAVGRVDSRQRRAGQGAATGAWIGFSAGGLLAAGLCTNPFTVPACVSALMLGGYYGGAIIGATYGFTGFSAEDQLYVNAVLSEIDQRRDFQKELASELYSQSETFWAPVESAVIQALVRLERVQLNQNKDVSIRFTASLTFSWVDESAGPSASTLMFTAESIERPIDDWLTNDGDLFSTSIDAAMGELAKGMFARLVEMRNPPSAVAEPS